MTRRSVVGGAALGSLLALSGCGRIADLPGVRNLPFVGGGQGPAQMLTRLPSSLYTDDEFLSVNWTRPAAIVEQLDLSSGSALGASTSPEVNRLKVVTISDPVTGNGSLLGNAADLDDLEPWYQVEQIRTCSQALTVMNPPARVTVMEGAGDQLDLVEEMLSAAYTRDGDLLRPDSDLLERAGLPAPADSLVPATIGAVSGDLVFTSEDSLESIDGRNPLSPEDLGLQEMLDAIDLPGAHIARGLWRESPDEPYSSYLWMSELDGFPDVTTRGAVRATGDPQELADTIEEAASTWMSGPVVRMDSLEIEEDLLIIELEVTQGERPYDDALTSLYQGMSGADGPGLQLMLSR